MSVVLGEQSAGRYQLIREMGRYTGYGRRSGELAVLLGGHGYHRLGES